MAAELDLTDLAARATAAAQGWAPGSACTDITVLTGGQSSLTYTTLVEGGPTPGERIVLKVAPPGLEPVRNRDVSRQARLMRALAGAPGVRVPTVYFEDDGAPPAVPPFHAMNLIRGECVEPIFEVPTPETAAQIPARAFGAAEMLARLHDVDPAAVGMGGEAVTDLETEVRRWTRAFETVPPEMNDRYLEAEALLLATMPKPLRPSFCHGDYRLGNMLCDGETVAALIDWEIWTLSDPRLDLAWFCLFTEEAMHPMRSNHEPTTMPSDVALLDAYAAAAGAMPADLEWFHCLVRYKESATSALLIKRALKAGMDLGGVDWRTSLPALTRECIERLEGFTPTA